jgi:hypothetical protein
LGSKVKGNTQSRVNGKARRVTVGKMDMPYLLIKKDK